MLGSWTSPSARSDEALRRSERRARKISVSTALTDTPSVSAISSYERPSSSRMTSAERWLNGSWPSARRIERMLGFSDSGTMSRSTESSSGTSWGRRCARMKRVRHALCAILISQFWGFSMSVPSLNAR